MPRSPVSSIPRWLQSWQPWLSHGVMVTIILALFLFLVLRQENVHRRYGDAHVQALTMVAGKNFVEKGLIDTKFTPLIQNKTTDYSSVEPVYFFYTHYPPFPYYVGALVWSLGGRTLVAFKIVTISVGIALLLLFYFLIAKLLNRPIAALATLLFTFQVIFFQLVIEEPTVWDATFQMGAFLLLVYALEWAGRGRQYALLGSWCMLFLCSYSSFEFIMSSIFFVAAYTVWKTGRQSLWIVLFLISAPFVAFFVHFLNNAWVLGGVVNAFDDLYQPFLWRTLEGGRQNTDYLGQIGGISRYPFWLAKTVWVKYGFSYLSFGAVVATLAWVQASSRMPSLAKKYLIITGIFAIGSMTFWVAFPQATYVEFNVLHARHWLPTYSLLLGGASYFLLREAWRNRRSAAALAPLVLLLLVGQQITSNLQATTQFVREADERDWAKELQLFRRAGELMQPATSLIVEDPQLTRFSFYHQPREVFGLPEFKVYLVHNKEELSEWEAKSRAESIYFLRSLEDSSLEVESSWQQIFDDGDYALYELGP